MFYPPVKPYTWRSITPRETIPVYPPPGPLEYPSLPSKPRTLPVDSPFRLSTHIIPAAYLRTNPYVPAPTLPPGLSKAERMAHNRKTRAQLRIMSAPPVTPGHPRLLWNCLNRYIRRGARRTGLTLFFAHANGYPKEIWEPVIKRILSSAGGELVDEIWSWEAVQHGDSALLNRDSLGGLFDWTDNGRDILNFLLNFLPSAVHDTLPTCLERISLEETQYRQRHGLKNRKLIAIGHSYGGCSSAFAALENPKLFSSLMLVDPVIIKPYDREEDGLKDDRTNYLVSGALNRREVWSSKEEALESFRKNPFFGTWDPEALELYVEYGLYNTKDSDGQQISRLKMPAIQEAIVFSGTLTQFEVFHRLPTLDERIELRWVVPGKPGAGNLGAPGSTHMRVWVRPRNSSNIRIPNAGHLIPQETPQELVQEITNFIKQKCKDEQSIRSNL